MILGSQTRDRADDAGHCFSREEETFPASAFTERRLNETDIIIGRQVQRTV